MSYLDSIINPVANDLERLSLHVKSLTATNSVTAVKPTKVSSGVAVEGAGGFFNGIAEGANFLRTEGLLKLTSGGTPKQTIRYHGSFPVTAFNPIPTGTIDVTDAGVDDTWVVFYDNTQIIGAFTVSPGVETDNVMIADSDNIGNVSSTYTYKSSLDLINGNDYKVILDILLYKA
jgi:hypothetical protein